MRMVMALLVLALVVGCASRGPESAPSQYHVHEHLHQTGYHGEAASTHEWAPAGNHHFHAHFYQWASLSDYLAHEGQAVRASEVAVEKAMAVELSEPQLTLFPEHYHHHRHHHTVAPTPEVATMGAHR